MEPTKLFAGANWAWETTVPGYSAADGYSIEYILANASSTISFVDDATATGETFSISLDPATTAAYAPGDYTWYLFAVGNGERVHVSSGAVEVLPDISDGSTPLDGRSHVKKTLDALEAMIEGKASKDQQSYSVAGRSLSRMSPDELLKWRARYRAEYAQEVAAGKIAAGKGNPNIIKTTFKGATP